MKLSPYVCNSFRYRCPVESRHLWQTWVVGFQSCWELRAWTVAAPWSDSVECSPTCHVFHSAQFLSSSSPFSDHKWRLVSEIPLQRTHSQTGATFKNSSYRTSFLFSSSTFTNLCLINWDFTVTFSNSSNLPYLTVYCSTKQELEIVELFILYTIYAPKKVMSHTKAQSQKPLRRCTDRCTFFIRFINLCIRMFLFYEAQSLWNRAHMHEPATQ